MESSTIIARAPVRVSLGGGGTDIAAYYAEHGGFVVSTAITRYASVTAREPSDGKIHISSADYNVAESLDSRGGPPPLVGALSLPRAALAHFWKRGLRERGVELALSAEVPPGTGLGSSSAMAVALVHALAAYTGAALTKAEAAALACEIEIERMGMPIGRQDQYASAFGGLNTLRFSRSGVAVEPLALDPTSIAALGQRLMLFATGLRRHSSAILRRQSSDSASNPETIATLHRVKALAGAMRDALLAGELDEFGQLLDASWHEKRRLSGGISSNAIDAWYAAARAAGAIGGKIAGAGGGGFMLFYCPEEHQGELRAALGACGLRELTFDLDQRGAQYEVTGDRLQVAAVRAAERLAPTDLL